MSNQLNRKQEIKQEKKKFNSLPLNQKIGYIKDYYSIHIIAVIVICLIGFFVYKTYQEKNYNTYLYAVLINNDTSDWDSDIDSYEHNLSSGFAEHVGIDNVNDRVVIDNNYIINIEKDHEMSVYSAETLVALMYGKGIDVVIGDNLAIDYFCDDDYTFFYEYNTLFDDDFIKKYEDKLVWHTYDNQDKVPIAFDVTDCAFIKNANLTVNPVYISIVSNTEHLEAAMEYVKFILES